MDRTLAEIREDGLDALRQRLGRAGLIRFLQQFELGSGDYSRERRTWVDGTTLDDLRAAARQPRTQKRKSSGKQPRRISTPR